MTSALRDLEVTTQNCGSQILRARPKMLIYNRVYILNYKRNPSVTSQGNYGKHSIEMKIYLYRFL